MSTLPLIAVIAQDVTAQSPELPRYGVPALYIQAVAAAGGLPIIIPPVEDLFSEEFFSTLAGCLFVGGIDINPRTYNETPHEKLGPTSSWRDEFELKTFAFAEKLKLPVLGICRGCQMMNVSRGGTLIQHLEEHPETEYDPQSEADGVMTELTGNSVLSGIIGEKRILTNSLHHQAVKDLGRDLKVTAYSVETTTAPTRVVEAIEDINSDRFFLGVQWHPEMMPNSLASKKLFKAFVDAAKKYHSTKR